MGRGLMAENAVCFSLEIGPACRFPSSRGTRPLGCGVWLGLPRCPPTAGLAVGTPVVCPWSRRVQCLARRRAQEADGGLSPIWGSAWTAVSALGCATSWSGGRDSVGSRDRRPRVRRVCAGVVGLRHRQGPPCHPAPPSAAPPPPCSLGRLSCRFCLCRVSSGASGTHSAGREDRSAQVARTQPGQACSCLRGAVLQDTRPRGGHRQGAGPPHLHSRTQRGGRSATGAELCGAAHPTSSRDEAPRVGGWKRPTAGARSLGQRGLGQRKPRGLAEPLIGFWL